MRRPSRAAILMFLEDPLMAQGVVSGKIDGRASFIGSSEGWAGVEAAAAVLGSGGSALDAAERAVRLVEDEPGVRSVGAGGYPNCIGELELDATVMEGGTRRCGSVGALKGFAHPVSVARAVMERLPHVLIVGEGASRFAAEIGAEPAGEDELSRESYRTWFEGSVADADRDLWPRVPLIPYAWRATDPQRTKGTVCFLCRDVSGEIAAAVSTSGWAWKYPGRLGDSPIVGAGCYADNRYGAAACIGNGEMAIRAGTARSVVLAMKFGLTLEAACREAAADYRSLAGGYRSWVTIHAMDRDGGVFALDTGKEGSPYFVWETGFAAPVERTAVADQPPE